MHLRSHKKNEPFRYQFYCRYTNEPIVKQALLVRQAKSERVAAQNNGASVLLLLSDEQYSIATVSIVSLSQCVCSDMLFTCCYFSLN